ncbi:hypothetical protein [Streptomyces sedi]|uniref:ATP-binding protein n=1 Tax=Streptomyces sedi TaxID=555059 RepID=A0A5C4V226_9ACTN|nr:hypothetical protein [Streptomyces sedi]TNM29139.1 hypothetical protein FH715_16470 [Streptomyces sedi]
MKHATAKTLGVAAMGAAFAATAAGSASAMSLNDGLATATGEVANSIPVQETVDQVAGEEVGGVSQQLMEATPTNDALGAATQTLTHTTGLAGTTDLIGGLAPGALGAVDSVSGLAGATGALGGVV